MIFPLVQFLKFSVGSVFPITHLRFRFNIYVWLHLKKHFLRGDLSALRKPETEIFHRFSFLNFSIGSVFPITHLRFRFNIYVWLCLKYFLCGDLSALGKPETEIFHRFSFPNFSVGSVFPITHLRLCFNIYVWLCIKHSCMDIYAW